MIYSFLTFCVLPPGNLLLATILCLILGRRAWARIAAMVCIVALYMLSTPLVANSLFRLLEVYPPLVLPMPSQVQAIVVLSAEATVAPEFDTITVGELTMTRLRYAAYLHRQTKLPVIATGGVPGNMHLALGEMMRRTLENELGVQTVWVEDAAQDTWQNARFSAHILATHNVNSVALVTSAWHMRRAMIAFEESGLQVTAAPTGFHRHSVEFSDLLPQARSMLNSYYAAHEFVGILFYKTIRSGLNI